MKIAIIGAGGVGGYFGGKIAKAGYDVTFLARGEHYKAIAADGLTVKSTLGDFHIDVDLDRLGEIAEESCLQTFLDIVWHGIGAEGKHRDMRRCRISAQDFQRLDTADAWQIDVHHNHFR